MPIRKLRMEHWQFPILKGGIFRTGKEIEWLRGGVLGYAAQASPKIDAARTEKDPFRMETSWATSGILPLRSGQSRPKAGCKRKGFIYGQALISATFKILKGACGRDRPISLHRPCRSGSKCSPGAHGAARNEQTGLLIQAAPPPFSKACLQ